MRRRYWAGLLIHFAAAAAIAQILSFQDLGLSSGLQDLRAGHFQRGRAMIAADFDLDGRIDLYVGNPSQESVVLRNTTTVVDDPQFETVQTLVNGDLAWGAVAFDYDNDGDFDIFITCGGNEGSGLDYLFRNEWLETGQLSFTDVSAAAGIQGPTTSESPAPVAGASANAVTADYDLDGDVDVFVNTNSLVAAPPVGLNILWRNEGDGTFSNVTAAVGLDASVASTRHSTFFDFDNDGDADLFENNFDGPNVLWRNRLKETGTADFEDVTAALSNPPIEDLAYPLMAFASAAADFDNDGWEDLMVFTQPDRGTPSGGPYPEGHALFLNQAGLGFENVATASGINASFPEELGVMGCQAGDLNTDGVPDLFMGNGGPPSGRPNELYLSVPSPGGDPLFVEATPLIDYAAPEDGVATYPPYGYRTHGTAFVDLDGDGVLEIAVANGGPSAMPDIVREPNRLFRSVLQTVPDHLKVRPRGDGVTVSRDAIGTRASLVIEDAGGGSRTVHKTLYAGSGFSGQNGFELIFYWGATETPTRLTVTWPGGGTDEITSGLTAGAVLAPMPCLGAADLAVSDQDISTAATFTACNSITLGPALRLLSGAEVELTAPNAIVFLDGVEVDAAASLDAGHP